MERISASVDPGTKKTLERIAGENRTTISQVLRILAQRIDRGEIKIQL